MCSSDLGRPPRVLRWPVRPQRASRPMVRASESRARLAGLWMRLARGGRIMADRSYRRAPADRPPNPRPDRGEPHEWETERALLGGILTAPELLGNLADLPAEVFHRPAHAHLWALVVELHRSGARPDQLVATAEIERRGEADKCGSLPYVDSLPQACPSIEAVPGYARRLREIAAARALRREAQATEIGRAHV